MQQISQEDKTKVDSLGRIRLTLYENGVALPVLLREMQYIGSGGGETQFSIGASCSAYAELTADGMGLELEEKSVSLKWSADAAEYPLISGTILEPQASGGTTTFTIRDAMYTRGMDEYDPDRGLLEECTAADVLLDIARKLDVPLDSGTAEKAAAITLADGIKNLPLGITLGAAAGQIAALMGGNALISRAGALTVQTLLETGEAIEAYAGGDTLREAPYKITGLNFRRIDTVEISTDTGTQTVTQTVDYPAGTAESRLMAENSLATTALAEKAWEALGPQEFYSGSFSLPGGLLLEPMDIITVILPAGRYRVSVAQTFLHWDGGCRTNITATGSPILQIKQVGFVNRKLNDLDKRVYNLQTSVNGLVSTAAEIKSDTQQAMTSILQNAEAIVTEAMKNYVRTGDLDSYRETVSSQFTQMADQLSITLTRTTETLNEYQTDMQGKYDSITKCFRFADQGLIIGETGNEVLLRLDNDIIQFLQNNVPALYISPEKVFAEQVHINSIILGKYVFQYELDGRLSLRKV